MLDTEALDNDPAHKRLSDSVVSPAHRAVLASKTEMIALAERLTATLGPVARPASRSRSVEIDAD
jgi:hypothetical protein